MPKLSSLMVYMGIDPGQSGGLAAIAPGGITLEKMPPTERDTWDWIWSFGGIPNVVAIIEKVHSFPGQGVSSTFKFGMGFGGLKMALTAAMIPYEEVDPRRWQKALGIPPRKKAEDKKKFKLRLKAFAQKLFPRVEGITLETCDALLIAEFARRYREGLSV